MSLLTGIAPIPIGIIAFTTLYIANKMRERAANGMFEFLFGLGNLFVLATLFVIFLSLQNIGSSSADTVFPIFQAMLWIYLLICLVLVFSLLKHVLEAMWNKKLREYAGV